MRTLLFPAIALALLAGSCGGAEKPVGLLSGVVGPLPVPEVACPAAHCPDSARMDELAATLQITETAGVGATLSGVQLELHREVTGSTAATAIMDAAAVMAAAGPLKVPAKGQLSFPVALRYDQLVGGRPGLLSVTFAGQDDNGHLVGSVAVATISPRGPLPSAALTAALSPSPIHEGPCPASHCGALTGQDEAAGILTLGETAGVGVLITSVAMTLKVDGGGATLATGTLDDAAITAAAGSTPLPAKGQLAVPIGVHYDQSLGGQHSTLTVIVNALDENAHPLTKTATVAVGP